MLLVSLTFCKSNRRKFVHLFSVLQGSTVEFPGTKPSYPSQFLEVEPMTEQNVHDLDIGENEEASLVENGVVKIGAPCAQTN
ncbi:hypothetical protein FGIG_03499 [Fasciola gigantica]|uniref:Uncharacterized protein n=1 Tax=Fasciola gigantica TaxID=46835 RepID=A0A504Z9V1_FASGI|nr:hypothetical protein FGIG_03499 [Fasciola gigantica]